MLQVVKKIFKSKITIQLNKKLKYSISSFDNLLQHPYIRICRFEKPIGAMLLYWPITWGVAASSLIFPSPYWLSLFFMGSFTSRAAGCIINDYLDRNFDKNVQRTKNRPFAQNSISKKEGVALLFLNLSCGLYVLTQLPLQSLLMTFCILPIAGLYPLSKRYTKYPQLILGVAFNSGILIGGLAVNPLDPNWIILFSLYISGICWTLVYDTVYAFQDIEYDKKIGINSTAISWGQNNYKVMNKCISISSACFIFITVIDNAFIYGLPIFLGSHYFLYKNLKSLKQSNVNECGKFFKNNTFFGIAILIGIIFNKINRLKVSQSYFDILQYAFNHEYYFFYYLICNILIDVQAFEYYEAQK